MDIKAVVDAVERESLPSEWLVGAYVFKEKEKKIMSRGYLKNTYEIRLYQVATESNLAKNILPYISTQSMTKSEEETYGGLDQTMRGDSDQLLKVVHQSIFLYCLQSK